MSDAQQHSHAESSSAGVGPTRRDLIAVAAAAAALGPTAAAAQTRTDEREARMSKFWPNDARLAIALTMVVEAGGDPPPTMKGPDDKKYPDLFGATAAEYSSLEAIPRMLDLFDRRGLKVTALMCGQSAERFPALAKEIAQRGHECAAHGKTHAVQFQMSRDEEHAFIQGAVDLIKTTTGQTPVGYNCARQARSVNTLSLLQELGFLYHVDDVSRDEPFIIPVDSKPFVVVPYTQHLTDFSFFNRGPGASDAFVSELRMEFDALYAEGASRRRMMAVTLHDSIARPARVKAVEDFLVYAQRHKGVWITRCDEIAQFAKSSPATIKETKAT